MSIHQFTSRLAANHRAAKQQRDLYRAIGHASTPALRQELLSLSAYDNR